MTRGIRPGVCFISDPVAYTLVLIAEPKFIEFALANPSNLL